MNMITRRNIIGSAGLAVAGAPFAFPKVSDTVFGHAAPSPNPTAPPSRVFSDLSEYTQSGVGSVIVAAKNGSLSPAHLESAASRTHLFARHIESLHIDKDFSSLVASTSFSAYSGNVNNYRTQALASAQTLDPTFRLSDIPSFNITQEGFEAIRTQVSSLGLTGVHHSVADVYGAAKKHVNPGGIKPAVWDPKHHASLNDLIYRSNQAPHVLRATSACPDATSKEEVCDELNIATGVLTITGTVLTIIGALCVAEIITLGPLGAALCGLGAASLGASIALHGLALWVLMTIMGC